MSKARYIGKISYAEEFKPTIDLFNEIIMVDPKVKVRNPDIGTQRFSAVIRDLIQFYVRKRLEEMKQANETKQQPKQTQS